jgi:hypothetical protein
MAQESVRCYSPIVLTLPRRTSMCSGLWSDIWEFVDSTVMKKRKWLSVNGCDCKSPISTATELLNSCQDGTNACVLGDYVEQQWYFTGISEMHQCCDDISFNFMTRGNLLSNPCMWCWGNVPEKIILPRLSEMGVYCTRKVLLIASCAVYRRCFMYTVYLASNSWYTGDHLLWKKVVVVYFKLLFQHFSGANEGKQRYF